MKRIIIAALTLLLLACASAPPAHVNGRYALTTTESLPISDAELAIFRDALRQYITVVDVVPNAEAASAYDGVIVVGWNTTTNRVVPRQEPRVLPAQGRVIETTVPNLPQPRAASERQSGNLLGTNDPGIALIYDVLRNGKEERNGVVRVPIGPNPSPEQLERGHDRYLRAADIFARDVAKQLGKL